MSKSDASTAVAVRLTGLPGTTLAFTLPNTFTGRPYYALSEVFTVGGSVPVFTDSDPAARSVPENSRAFTNVGALVAATDADIGDTLTYSLGGTDAASFDIGSTSGRILTKAGVSYDHETKSRYSVEVTVTDGTYSATIAVNITVTDVDEPPSAAPGAPTVSAVTSPDRLYVTWTAPANTSHRINDYDVRYRTDGSGAWTSGPTAAPASPRRSSAWPAARPTRCRCGPRTWKASRPGRPRAGPRPARRPPSP